MTDQVLTGVTDSVSQATGFSPLEVVLMSAVAILFTALMGVMVKLIKEVISTSKDMHNALDNNTKALEKIPDLVQDKIELALKKCS